MDNFLVAQTLEIELQDDSIVARKWKREIQSGDSTRFFLGVTNNTKAMLQKFPNQMISMKRQMGKPISFL